MLEHERHSAPVRFLEYRVVEETQLLHPCQPVEFEHLACFARHAVSITAVPVIIPNDVPKSQMRHNRTNTQRVNPISNSVIPADMSPRIAREEHGSRKVVVIAGVGTRHYYRKLGYELDGPYVSKWLAPRGQADDEDETAGAVVQ